MSDIYKYVGVYLLSYIVIGMIYAFAQNYFICTDMIGYECNFDENKLLAFLTVVAYILTPIVAIFGFMNWKLQYKYQNQKDRFSKLFELTLLLNSEIKILRSRDISIREINANEKLTDYEQNYLDKKYEEYLDNIGNLERIYEECLINLSILEFSLNKRMNGFRKLVINHEKIFEECRSNYFQYLETFNNKNKLLRDIYWVKISSRRELMYENENKCNPEINFEMFLTKRIERLTFRINKYINKIENFY